MSTAESFILHADAPLEDVPFVIVDTETTGTQAEDDRLLEVAAVRVQGGEIQDTFSQLINPGRTVPRRITQLTGITTGMVFDQPPAAEVLPRLLAFLGDGVFTAHNVSFDRRFLNAELERLSLPTIKNQQLCTLRLARRLLPGLESKGLTALAQFYGIRNEARHRAHGDALATAEVLLHLLKLLTYEHEIETLGQLLTFQHRTYRAVRKPPKHVERIRQEVLPALPDRPGVYFMKDHRGDLLYIGKAKSLRDRVRSYFTGVEALPERTMKLVKTLRTVEWQETGSELGALLLESKLIKALKPRFNRAQRRYRNRPFLRLDTSHEAPRLTTTAYVQDDGAEYFGPLSGRRQAELLVDIINRVYQLRECDDETYRLGRKCLYAAFGRCTAPCIGGEARAAYDDEVARVRTFLLGQDRSVLAELEARMRTASAEMKYEEAAEYRDWLRRLEHLLDKQEQMAAPVLDHNAVLVHPGTEAGTAELYLIRFGRLAETVVLAVPPVNGQREHLHARLAAHFDAAQERPARYLKQEVDEVRILAHWLYVHRDSTTSVQWQPGTSLEQLVEQVLEVAGRET